MARYSAPDDVSGVSLNCGEFSVVDGFITVPDDHGEGDCAGLNANGFRLVEATELKASSFSLKREPEQAELPAEAAPELLLEQDAPEAKEPAEHQPD